MPFPSQRELVVRVRVVLEELVLLVVLAVPVFAVAAVLDAAVAVGAVVAVAAAAAVGAAVAVVAVGWLVAVDVVAAAAVVDSDVSAIVVACVVVSAAVTGAACADAACSLFASACSPCLPMIAVSPTKAARPVTESRRFHSRVRSSIFIGFAGFVGCVRRSMNVPLPYRAPMKGSTPCHHAAPRKSSRTSAVSTPPRMPACRPFRPFIAPPRVSHRTMMAGYDAALGIR
jgi:hypothetical protein